MTDLRECGMDAGAYVIGDMSGAEKAAFRLHITVCAACRDEADELEQAIAALPLMVPDTLPPTAPARSALREARAEPREQARRALRRSDANTPPPSGDSARTSRRHGRRPSRPATAGFLALMVAAGLTIALTFVTSSTTVYQAEIDWAPGAAVVRVSNGHGELLAKGMPPAPSGKVYEVWLERGATQVSPADALFEVTADGHADVKIPGDLSGVSRVIVTPEPTGGSHAPTELPVLAATLG